MNGNPKQNRNITIFAIFLSLISIGILILGFTIVSSDKVVMLQSVSNLHNKISNYLEENFTLIDKIASSKDIGINAKTSISVGSGKYYIKTDYLENSSDERSSLDLSIDYNEENIIAGSLLFDDNKLYTFIKDITPDYYQIDYDYTSVLKTLSRNDYEKIFSLLKEAINDSISNDDIKKEKVTIDYNGSQKKVNKLTYIIDTKELKSIINEFISSVEKDKALIKNIASIIDVDIEDLVNDLDSFLKLFDVMGNENLYSYNTYYYGFNKIVAYEFYSYTNDTKLTYKVEKDKETISIDIKGYNTFNLVINENKDNYSFNGSINAFLTSLEVDDFNNTATYDFSGTYSNDTLELIIGNEKKYKVTMTSNSNQSDNVYKYNYSIKISDLSNKKEKEIVTIDSEIEYYFDKKVELEVESSKEFNELSEEELNLLNENLDNNLLYQFIKASAFFEYFI